MPYSKKYDEEKHREVEGYIGQLEKLPTDKVLTIPTSSPEDTERLSWLLHDYLHLVGCGSLYQVKQFLNNIIVGRKGVKPTLSNLIAVPFKRNITGEADKIIRELITSSTPREVLYSLLKDENISLTALSIILAEYSRVMEA